jgi:hypothetical protein
MAEQPDAEAAFAALAARYAGDPDVEPGTGFGSVPGLRVGGKIFAMLMDGALVVKLPAERCTAIVEGGGARPLAVGRRTMREWVVLDGAAPAAWPELADAAYACVRG